MKKIIVTFLVLALISPLLTAAPPKGQKTIAEADLRAHLEFLASEELAGRDAPGFGSEIAQRYIATRFAQYGLKEFPEAPGYYQTIPIIVEKADYDRSRMVVIKYQEVTTELKSEPIKCFPQENQIVFPDRIEEIEEFIPNQDVFFFPRSGQDADIRGQVLLAGYGISAPEFEYDDFAGADPTGKILLVFNREPQENDSSSVFNGVKPTRYSNPVVKARLAQGMGASGLLIMQPPNKGLPPIEETLMRYKRRMNDPIVQLAEETDPFPIFYLKDHVVQAMLGDDFDLSAYQQGIDKNSRGDPRLLEDLEVTLRIRFKEVEEKTTANIVGYWPGKSNEAVLVMAHHDHEGEKDGQIYYGADDNASGCAGLLGIAQAFSTWGGRPKWSVVFLSSGAEEKGCLGAHYFTLHPPVPIEKIVAVINMDMIGRDGSSQFRAMRDSTIEGEKDLLMIFYSGQTPELAEVAEEENRSVKLNIILEPVLRFHGSSDHVPFHDLRIPSAFLFTGFHSDYSSPKDTPDKIVYPKLAKVAQFAFGVAYNLAQRKGRPLFDASITEVEKTGREYGN